MLSEQEKQATRYMNDKQLLKRLASLSPEQRETLLKQLQKKKAQAPQTRREGVRAYPRGEHPLPLSYAQQRLWFLDQFESGEGSTYNISAALRLTGELDVEALRMAFEEIVNRHEALRTTFVADDGQGRQVIGALQRWELLTISLEPLSVAEQEEVIARRFRGDSQTAFDLINGPLLRTRLIRLARDRHVLIVTMHHIVSDGWSMGVLIREVATLYSAFRSDQTSPLAPLKIQYADYAQWQREWLAGERLDRQLSYWRTRLEGVPILELPTDFPRSPVLTHEGASVLFEIDAVTTQAVLELSRKQGVTLFMALLSAMQVLLYRYSGQNDICVGTPIAGRTRPELEELIGCFVNTLAIRSDLSEQPSFSSLLKQVQQNLTGAYDHQDIPFERLVDELGIPRELSHTPLFQVMFVLQNATSTQALNLPGLSMEVLPEESYTAKFDITLAMREEGGKLKGSWEYRTTLFSESTIRRMQAHLVQVLKQAAANPSIAVDEIELLSAIEQKQLLVDWNSTKRPYPRDASLGKIFESVVDRFADRIAVRESGFNLTYRELDSRANAIAQELLLAGVKPGHRVGLCADRCAGLVAAVLGIIKVGASYVPLDPAYPTDRLVYMLEDAAVNVLISHSHLRDRLPVENAQVIVLDSFCGSKTEESSVWGKRPEVEVSATAPAYVMYTSGSTGKPKGIEVVHRNILRLALNTDFMQLDEHVVFLQYAPISFDAATLELWGPLLNGGSVAIAPPGQLDPEGLGAFMRDTGTNAAWLTAALFHFFVQFHLEELRTLKQLLAGGDVLSPALVRKALTGIPGLVLINGYGPTENTTFTCCYPMRSIGDVRNTVPIGRPIANTRVYVLDANRRPVPRGVPGELYTSGDGVANGYLNRDELSREVFLPNPFDAGGDPVMYKTGDLVRYYDDGNLEYLGRIDQLVKIRGFRIELGEIEQAIAAINTIEQVAVIAREDTPGVKKLVAYVVPVRGQIPTSHELRSELKQRLPEYMVPSAFVVLESLPVTANGKLDRRALPKPAFEDAHAQKVGPRDEKERVLVEIWQQVLNLQDIGVHDNFFELGGDSILSIQITSRAKVAGLHITTKQVFENQTIAELAVVASDVEAPVLAEQGLVHGEVILAPVQQWFFDHEFTQEQHWNQSVLLDLKPEFAFTEAQIKKALCAVVLQHDALRLRFERSGHNVRQFHDENPDGNAHFTLRQIDLNVRENERPDDAITRECNSLQASLDLQGGPLLAAGLICVPKAGRKLLLVIHHLVIDGVSWRVLLDDFIRALQAVQKHDDVSLGLKTTSYKQWADALAEHVRSGEFDNELEYWRNTLAGAEVNLPIDFPEGSNNVVYQQVTSARLAPERTSHLLREVNRAYRTEINDLLLTALAKTLADWTGRTDILIDMEGHGREIFNDRVDLSRTVGWFTSIYPVRLAYDSALGLASNLKANKQRLHSMPNRGFGFGGLKSFSQSDALRREFAARPKSEIVFNYLGQFDSLIENSPWFAVATASRGDEHSLESELPHTLSINSHIVEGALQVDWIYSADRFSEGTIQALADAYIANLQRLIEHCLSPDTFGYTPSDFPLAGLDQLSIDRLFGHTAGIEAVYPLSPMQEGMLFHSMFEDGSTAYFEQLSVEVMGDANRELLLEAWGQVIRRHPIMRSAFHWQDMPRPLQVVHTNINVEMNTFDWRDTDPSQVESKLSTWMTRDRQRGFEVERPGLTRMSWIDLPGRRARMIWSFHHVVLDGWSLPLVIGEVFMIYTALAKGRAPQLPAAGRYEDFIGWLERSDKEGALKFWKRYMEGFQAPTPLAGKKPLANSDIKHDYADELIHYSSEFTGRLQQFARENHVTLNTLIQGAWGILLSRYSGENDVVFGTTVSGRPAELAGVEHIVGLFINTLPLRLRLNSDTRVVPLLQAMQEEAMDIRRFESTPLVDIHRTTEVPGDQSLFESILVFENYPIGQAVHEADELLDVGNIATIEHTNYPLTLIVMPGASLEVRLSYDATLFDRPAVQRILDHLEVILKSALAQPDVPVLRIPILRDDERNNALHAWNPADSAYPRNKCVDDVFEEVVLRAPHALAAVDGDYRYTYEEINARANRLARYIIEQGVEDQDFVAIALERSVDMLVAMLATLKAGCAYLPVDPFYPEERINFMLADTRAPVVITRTEYRERILPAMQALEKPSREILLDTDSQRILEKSSSDLKLRHNSDPQRVAYAVYTSGSTGKPKGVVCTHIAITRLVMGANYFQLAPHDRMAHLSNVSFDAATWEIWGAFLNGASLVVFQKEQLLTPEAFAAEVDRTKVNCVFITTALFNAFAIHQPQLFPNLKYLLFGGEACDPQQVRKIARHYKPEHFLHVYGPSENTTYSTWYEIQDVADNALTVPIGRSISGSTAYILDKYLQPVPVGVAGEIYVGGDGLAVGYLNDPEKTAAAFVPNPLVAGGESRLYKTGDLARYTEDGFIEILGRSDDQVKIRGFRIELGEVEAQLTRLDGVREAVVVVKQDGPSQKKLIAYVLCDGLDVAGLRREAARHLPKHMVPSAFVIMEQFPLTQNGKVNKRALPEPTAEAIPHTEFVGARNEKEQILTEIWQQVLKADTVGIHDNFFELGGDSILSIQIISRAKRAGLHITAKQIFEFQTIFELAEAAAELSQYVQTEQGMLSGDSGLLPVQRWFFESLPADAHHFNQSVMLSVDAEISLQSLKDAWEAVLYQHDALRMVFSQSDDLRWEARFRNFEHIETFLNSVFEVEDLSGLSHDAVTGRLEALANQAQAGLSLNGPLVKIVYFNLGDQQAARMLVVIHHLIVDIFSWRVLLEDLQTALAQVIAGQRPDLGQKATSVRQWAMALYAYANSEAMHDELQYWRALAHQKYAKLSSDRNEPNTVESVRVLEASLTTAETRSLLTETHGAYRTEINDLLLTALARSLSDLLEGDTRGQNETLLVELEGHGREYLGDHIDISRTVGWFTSIYPVALPVSDWSLQSEASSSLGAEAIGLAIKATKESLHAVPNKGFGFGCLRYLSSSEETRRELAKLPRAALSFNYLGQLDQVQQEDGVIRRAQEHPGAEISSKGERSYAFEVSGRVLDNTLTMAWRYSAGLHDEATVKAFADRYMAALRALIRHCQTADNGGFTPSDFPLAKLKQDAIDRLFPGRLPIEAVYPLSAVQEGMLFHSLYEPGSWVYFDQINVPFHGKVDEEAMFAAWQQVIQRHAILRTGFLWEGVETPLQVVYETVEPQISRYDWSRLSAEEAQEKLQRYLVDDRNLGFNFRKPGVLRFSWIRMPTESKTGDETHQFLWSFHHILLDGWSLPIVFGELFAAYDALTAGTQQKLPKAPSYQSFIAWLARQDRHAAEAFWRAYLQGFTAPTPIPVRNSAAVVRHKLDHLDQHADRYREKEVVLGGNMLARLQEIAKQHRLTLNHIMQGVWAVLLSRYSGENDIVFGTTVSGRPADLPGVEQMVGLFINTLPLRLPVEAEKSFIGWLQKIQTGQVDLKRFESTSLVDVQQWSEVGGKQAMFESILVFENYPIDDTLEQSQASLRIGHVEAFQQTNFPLTLIGIPVKDTLIVRFSYDSIQFEEPVIQRMLGHIAQLMEGVSRQPAAPIRELPMVTAAEVELMTQSWNRTARDIPEDKTLGELFDAVATRHPNINAWSMNGRHVSYAQLQSRANRMAAYLVSCGVSAGDKVVISFERSIEMIVGILGILKAGAAYVPLDPAYPEDRMQYMVTDTVAPVIITAEAFAKRFEFAVTSGQSRVVVWEEISERLARMPEVQTTIVAPGGGDSVACVIYTSGSTGRPKGVLLPQKGLTRMVVNTNYWENSPGEKLTHAASLSFDAASFEIWGALLNGLTLVGIDKDTVLQPEKFAQVLQQEKPEHVFVTTALMNLISRQVPDVFANTRYVFFGGEASDPMQVRAILTHPGRPQHLMHMYGPCENSTYSTGYDIPEVLPGATTVPIGYPVANSTLYLLDNDRNPVPIGVPGEIYVGGTGLAHGYLNRPDLTEDAFLLDPFSQEAGARMYKTGDLGRFQEDGALEIIGRADDQVKIRGFRIEPGEIENVIAQLPGVQEACVLARQDEPGKAKILVAYLKMREGVVPNVVELRARVRQRLADFMVPSAFVFLDAVPITPNGKVDKKALPKPAPEAFVTQDFVGARNDTEVALTEIWCEVLEIERAGVYDDFFELGGHSLVITKLASRIKDRLAIELPLRTLFEVPTIAGLAEIIQSLNWSPDADANSDTDEEDFEEGTL
ncbi:Non-ribosomal peptide synthetase modules and related proteins [gamma proteobacterium HdN1]|nr:Non-ribosomal peptide synthetase modules and related proteins [gamma proteobacterium HdN1]